MESVKERQNYGKMFPENGVTERKNNGVLLKDVITEKMNNWKTKLQKDRSQKDGIKGR